MRVIDGREEEKMGKEKEANLSVIVAEESLSDILLSSLPLSIPLCDPIPPLISLSPSLFPSPIPPSLAPSLSPSPVPSLSPSILPAHSSSLFNESLGPETLPTNLSGTGITTTPAPISSTQIPKNLRAIRRSSFTPMSSTSLFKNTLKKILPKFERRKSLPINNPSNGRWMGKPKQMMKKKKITLDSSIEIQNPNAPFDWSVVAIDRYRISAMMIDICQRITICCGDYLYLCDKIIL